ncbi:uncharacterized protein LOC125660821 isoform X2 [Ostrea edulis]|uniref:uncharacterized protein LOC125660821 isoform X2 n=1 Tax=Ostrea edulis TaxID=37623 RepID=UPI0024AEADB1|nr:uncharacterized protein LOC125660821 isoform X2 [Ostrea edulis]XP_056008744.1 uncharacterized protein LOC125660821 isoform X2 [Ostrea edulis]
MDIDEKLREQSKVLLQKLKAKQGRLQQMLSSSTHEKKINDPVDTTVESPSDNDKRRSGREATQQYDRETISQTLKEYGRSQLKISKPNQIQIENKENFNQTSHVKRGFKPKEVMQEDSQRGKLYDPSIVYKKASSEVRYDEKALSAAGGVMQNDIKRKYPSKERVCTTSERRNLISRNVQVKGEEMTDMSTNGGLNFSYSRFDESDLDFVKSYMDDSSSEETPERYYDRLQEAGNDKKAAKIIQESYKPKSILQTTGPKTLKKSLGRVSFLTSQDSVGSDIDPQGTRHLLGYDWIAALLDNDRGTTNLPEGYFDELREFRRLNRDECVNTFYMEGPESLFYENSDPEPVKEILEDTKVKPYIVNDRLFTEPIKNNLIPGEESPHDRKSTKKPTQEDPRFVRVSIPRSTLLSTHRVKPHRRKSLEDTDSFSLSQHCMKGYENSVPSMVPTASNIGLRDASLGIKSKMQTTLTDAEKIAASFPYAWDTCMADQLKPANSGLYSSYQDMTLPYSMRSNVPGVGEESLRLKKATEDLLNSTYSLMYEMQNIKKNREIGV